MRVIGGKYKSRILESFSLSNVRPTADAVRESLFDIISDKIEGSVFLDLFSGTGAVGIEALSRGAKSVCFNDGSRESISLIKKNLSKLRVEEDYSISNLDAFSLIENEKKKYDIIFIDPPYKDENKKEIVCKCEKVLKDDGVIVLEDEKPFCYDTPLIKYSERKYGRVYLTFFRKAIPIKEPCLFAGTFDPLTLGHEKVIREALKRYSKVYVAIGENKDKKPFFSLEERLKILKSAFNDDRIVVDNYSGFTVDYMKQNGIKFYVRGIRNDRDYKYEKKSDSFNKTLYPEIKTEFIYVCGEEVKISSTVVRDKIAKGEDTSKILSKNVYQKIKEILEIKEK